jgi:hypothetical protein
MFFEEKTQHEQSPREFKNERLSFRRVALSVVPAELAEVSKWRSATTTRKRITDEE